jgi:aryl-alcohol dehydrogenase-like predicted oxidoreductase
MEYQKLGDTDLEVSKIGFGCWAIGGYNYDGVDDRDSVAAIHKALDLGINLFDTADVYGFGYSEKILSRGLGSLRDKVIIATKFGVAWDENNNTYRDCSGKRVIEALEGSLRRLKIACIPLYQIHCYDDSTPISETMESLEKCRKAGKIRHVGCSNFSFDLTLEANKVQKLESIQLLYSFAKRHLETDMQRCFEELKMGTVAYGVLGRGLFSGKYNLKAEFGKYDSRSRDENFHGEKLRKNLELVSVLRKIGMKYGKTPSQVAIRWVLDNPYMTCALTGIKRPEQIVENVGAVGWKLLKEDWKLLAKGHD